jgi:hypothetical protein
VTLYPSADVPASARLLRAREIEMQNSALRLVDIALDRNTGSNLPVADHLRSNVCYVGSYTVPYMLDTLMTSSPPPALRAGEIATGLPSLVEGDEWVRVQVHNASHTGSALLTFYNVEAGHQTRVPRETCATLFSFEYNPDGSKRLYEGRELRRAWHIQQQSIPTIQAAALW